MKSRRDAGQGSIYQIRDKAGRLRWRGVLVVGYRDGHRVRRSVTADTKREAQKRLAELRREVTEQAAPVVQAETVASFLSDWLGTIRPPRLKESTYRRYEQYVRLHLVPVLGQTPLVALTPQQIERLYADLLRAGLAARTVLHLHRVLHTALAAGVRWGQLARNVADLAQPPKPAPHQARTLSREQVGILVAALAGSPVEALVLLALSTGAREGELLGLRWPDVDLARGHVLIRASLSNQTRQIVATKTGRARQAPLLPRVADALQSHRRAQQARRLRLGPDWQDYGLVFPNEIGRPQRAYRLLRRSWYPLLEGAGLPRIRFHDLRHTCATLLVADGVPIPVVSLLLGHSLPSTTANIYAAATPGMLPLATASLGRLLGQTAVTQEGHAGHA